MWTSALFGAKNIGFFEIYGVSCPNGQGGLASTNILRTKGEGVNFLRFCADVLYGRPLTPNYVTKLTRSIYPLLYTMPL